MAIALVATVTRGGGPSGGTTAAMDTTGATLLTVSVTWYTGLGGTPAVSDSQGNTYTGLTTRSQGSTSHRVFYCLAPSVGTGHTVTVSGSGTYPAILASAFSGVASYQTESGATTAGAGPLASGALTPSVAGALVWTTRGNGSGPAVTDTLTPAGFTTVTVPFASGASSQGSAGYYVQPTAASIDPTWAWTGGAPTENGVATAVFLPPGGTGGGTAPVRVNVTASSDWSGGSALTYAAPALSITAGNLIAVVVGGYATSGQVVASLADTAGNTYTKVAAVREPGDQYQTEIWYAMNALASAANVVTATWTASTAYRALIVIQYSGAHTVRPLDGWATGTATSGAVVTTDPYTAANSSDVHLLTGRFGPAAGIPPAPSGFARVDADANAFVYEQFVTAPFTGTRAITYLSFVNARTALAVAFSADPAPLMSARVTQVVAETLTHPTPAARTTQLVVETLTSSSLLHPVIAQVTQLVVETLTLIKAPRGPTAQPYVWGPL